MQEIGLHSGGLLRRSLRAILQLLATRLGSSSMRACGPLVESVTLCARDAVLSRPKARALRASATWLFSRLLAHSASHNGRSPRASRRFQHRLHGRQWQHGNRSAVEQHGLNTIEAWRGHDHTAIGADSLYPDQDLNLNAFHHSQDSTRGAHVTTIPGCLIHHKHVLSRASSCRRPPFVAPGFPLWVRRPAPWGGIAPNHRIGGSWARRRD